MEANEMIQLGGLFFEKIEDGFERYQHEIISATPEELYQVIKKHIECNGWESCFVDFYYGSLKEDEKERIRGVVPVELQDILANYEHSNNLYFPLTPQLLELTWFLTIHEYLFSTYYFCKEPCTIWGNFNHTLVVFHRKDRVLA